MAVVGAQKMKTGLLLTCLAIVATSCATSRYIRYSVTEPEFGNVYLTGDGREMRNRPRLTARVEMFKQSDRSGYLVLVDEDDNRPVIVEGLYGWNPRVQWLRVSNQENKLMLLIDGGGNAGPNVILYGFDWAEENAGSTNLPPCHILRMHSIHSGNPADGQVGIGYDGAGYAKEIQYIQEEWTPDGSKTNRMHVISVK